MKPSKNRWADHYSRQAQKDKYPARSVYKLKEIQSRYRLIKPGDTVLDLGCSPGSWLMYAAEIVGKKGRVIGIDPKPVSIAVPPQVTVHRGDVFALEEHLIEAIGSDVDSVLSDMAPATTGNKDVDGARSLKLCIAALTVARRCLRPGGTFVCKIFQGEDFGAFRLEIKRTFRKQKIFKPRSSRKASREIYLIGTGKRVEEAACQDTANGPV
jgi:23S rRNA (uridine2552-2'-O)-methyltransferase